MDNILTINTPMGTLRFNSSQTAFRNHTATSTEFHRTAPISAPNGMQRIHKNRSRKYLQSKAQTTRPAALPLEEERKQVQLLDIWNSQENDSEAIKKLIEARTAFQNRLNKQDVVEMQLLERRGKNKIPLLLSRASSDQVLGLQKETTLMRLIKKDNDEQFRERCRYSKIFEDELKQTYNQLQIDLQKVNLHREELRKECSLIRDSIKSYETKYAAWKKIMAEEDRNQRMLAKQQGQAKMAGFLANQTAIKQQNSEKEAEYLNMINSADKQMKSYTAEIGNLDEASSRFRRQLLLVKEAQVNHFRSLLSEGKDTRNEGLIWIIKSLWSLGEDVIPEHFPTFLDEQSIEVILYLAQKTLEIDGLNSELGTFTGHKDTHSAQNYTEDRWNNIKSRLAQLKNISRTKYAVHQYNRKSKERLVFWKSSKQPFQIDSENAFRNTVLSDLLAIEQKIQFVRECINSAQEEELKRIAHECFINKYDLKHKISMKDLISSIVGFENVDRNMTIISKQQKDLANQLFHTKTFNFAQKITNE